ncbi:HNH endonuclease [Tetragenococcus halophilus]|uniref:HNH endonuclease n=1 Tax=Tetragenococcus halophilus TaxID=51669 RepID=UPI00209B450B
MTKLSENEVKELIKKYESGKTFTEIAKNFNVSRTCITNRIKKLGIYHLYSQKTCKLCGFSFHPSPHGSQIQKYCSDNCRQRAFLGKDGKAKCVNCKYCGNKFAQSFQRIYCSDECRKKQVEFEKKEAWRSRKCRYCGSLGCEFDGKFCSKKCKTNSFIFSRRAKDKIRYQRARRNGRFDSDIDIHKLIERDGERCYLCGDKVLFYYHYNDPKYPTIEHVTPIAKGGTHSWDNVKVACRECNTRKATSSISEFSGGEEFGTAKIIVSTKI